MAGCSKTDDSAATANNSPESSEQAASEGTASGAEEGGPAEAVAVFLDAVKNGQDEKANSMLTKLALQETAKLNMVVAPPGSDTASFEVGEVEMLSEGDEQGAQVASKWTDVGDDGLPHTDEIIWMLRKEAEGWRIAGMATTIFENEPPLLLDFENPQDMQRKQQLAEEEMQRRMKAELEGAEGDETKVAEDAASTDEERPERQARGAAAKKAARK